MTPSVQIGLIAWSLEQKEDHATGSRQSKRAAFQLGRKQVLTRIAPGALSL